MTTVSPQVSTSYPSTDGEPVAETFVHLYAMLISLEVLRPSTSQLEAERQRRIELQAELDCYRQQFGELPPES